MLLRQHSRGPEGNHEQSESIYLTLRPGIEGSTCRIEAGVATELSHYSVWQETSVTDFYGGTRRRKFVDVKKNRLRELRLFIS